MPTTAAARKLKWTLFGAQAMGSAGFLVASTVTPIVGAQLSGRPAYAGVPSAFYWAGGALATLLWGRLMDPLGRRKTLVLGLLVGVVGASLASVFVVRQSFLGFIVGLALMGAANSALQLARFMAGEVHRLEERGRAISTVVLGGTVGAVLGPTLVAPMSTLATSLGGPPLAGPYAASAAFFSLGAVLVALLLWPDPRDLARQVHRSAASSASTVRSVREILGDPGRADRRSHHGHRPGGDGHADGDHLAAHVPPPPRVVQHRRGDVVPRLRHVRLFRGLGAHR
jgi:MFS family permease